MLTNRERPILFSGPMVRAILEGRKTQTRRVVTPQPDHCHRDIIGKPQPWSKEDWDRLLPQIGDKQIPCPYGVPGDRLWVRETWQVLDCEELPLLPLSTHLWSYWRKRVRFATEGDYDVVNPKPWRPSIFMPRWASRITLEIASVRVERVQGISEADAVAEGCYAVDVTAKDIEAIAAEKFDEAAALMVALGPGTFTAKSEYAMRWDRINGKRPGCAWSDNPWVWVVEFRRVKATC